MNSLITSDTLFELLSTILRIVNDILIAMPTEFFIQLSLYCLNIKTSPRAVKTRPYY